jgi:hypothetical protein
VERRGRGGWGRVGRLKVGSGRVCRLIRSRSLLMVLSSCGRGEVGFRWGCWVVRCRRYRWSPSVHFENARVLGLILTLMLNPSLDRCLLEIDTVPRLSFQSPRLACRSRRLSRRKRRRKHRHNRSFRTGFLQLAERKGCQLRRRRRSRIRLVSHFDKIIHDFMKPLPNRSSSPSSQRPPSPNTTRGQSSIRKQH